MSAAYERFKSDAASAERAISQARTAIAEGEIHDLTPLGEIVETLCADAKAIAGAANDTERGEIGEALSGIIAGMDGLEEALRRLVSESAERDGADG